MKYKKIMFAAMLLASASFMTSCSEEKDKNEGTDDATMTAIAEQFVDHTVIPTYTTLAAKSQELVDALETLKEQKTDANVKACANLFLEAREAWERSEAFLFGAAADFGIDPHIDSWPLDESAFNSLMSSPDMLAQLEGDNGDVAAGNLGPSLLGFHGLEYILFKNGQPKSAAEITTDHLTYAVAVAGDLRNCCYQLEVSWAGDKAPEEHVARVEDLELNCTVGGGDYSYGDNLKNAGKAGSIYQSATNGLMAIVDGSKSIADEVGTSKIGKPHQGTSDEDIHYIESPYSWNSITDFKNNIISIQNSYMGGIEGQRDDS